MCEKKPLCVSVRVSVCAYNCSCGKSSISSSYIAELFLASGSVETVFLMPLTMISEITVFCYVANEEMLRKKVILHSLNKRGVW